MNKEQLMNNLYEIISNHIDELKYEDGANLYLTKNNKLFIDLNNYEQLFELTIKEEK